MDGAINFTMGLSEGIAWPWPIAVYLFLAGISGGAVAVALMLNFFRHKTETTPIIKSASIIGLATILLGMLCLVLDLTNPLYFWRILVYYNPTSVMSIGGVLLLFFTWRSMRNARALKAQGGRVTVDGNRVTYPEVEKGKVEYRSFLTTDIEYIKDDEEEHQCKVKTPDNYIIFEAKYFDSWEEFEAFRALLG